MWDKGNIMLDHQEIINICSILVYMGLIGACICVVIKMSTLWKYFHLQLTHEENEDSSVDPEMTRLKTKEQLITNIIKFCIGIAISGYAPILGTLMYKYLSHQ